MTRQHSSTRSVNPNANDELRDIAEQQLVPLSEAPLDYLLTKPAVHVPTLMAYGQAMFESAQRQRVGLFSFCIHLHSKIARLNRALQATHDAVDSLNDWFRAPNSTEPRAIAVFMLGVCDVGMHTHGMLLVPFQEWHARPLREIQRAMLMTPAGHMRDDRVVHLRRVTSAKAIPRITEYMLHNVRAIRPHDRSLDFTAHEGTAAADWREINSRVVALLEQRSQALTAARDAARERTELLSAAARDRAKARSSCTRLRRRRRRRICEADSVSETA